MTSTWSSDLLILQLIRKTSRLNMKESLISVFFLCLLLNLNTGSKCGRLQFVLQDVTKVFKFRNKTFLVWILFEKIKSSFICQESFLSFLVMTVCVWGRWDYCLAANSSRWSEMISVNDQTAPDASGCWFAVWFDRRCCGRCRLCVRGLYAGFVKQSVNEILRSRGSDPGGLSGIELCHNNHFIGILVVNRRAR